MIGNRIFGLDALRALAILLVVVGHGMQLLPAFHDAAIFFDKFFYLGVEIFFVLSGFLIGGILIKTINPDSSFSQVIIFWKRRWWRTLPNYYLFLAINIIGFGLLKPNFTFDWSYLIFAQNLLGPNAGFFSVSWSLAVEEWFYISTPLIYFAFLKITSNAAKSFWMACIFVIIFSMLTRIYYLATGDATWNEEMRKIVLLRLDSLMYGVIAAWLWHKHKDFLRVHSNLLLCVGMFFLLVSIAMKNHPNINNSNILLFFMYPMASIGAAFALPFFSIWQAQPKIFFLARAVTLTSIWSYSLYLVHIPLLEIYKMILYPLFKSSLFLQVFGFLLWAIVAYVFSFLIYRYYEYPMMQFRDKEWLSIIRWKNVIKNK